MDLISVFHMDVEWFGIYGPVENGLDMDYNFNPSGPTGDRPLSEIRKGTIFTKNDRLTNISTLYLASKLQRLEWKSAIFVKTFPYRIDYGF